jgi:hypothetical protein
MPRRASPFGPITSGAVCVLLAAAAPGYVSSAQAECIVQPNQQAPDGAHWSLHFDHAKNRRCWILVDASGHDLSTPQQPAASGGLSSFQSFLGNFTGATPAPQPQEAPASTPAVAPPPRKPPSHGVQPHVASANRMNHPARSEPKPDAHPAGHDMSPGERDALFEEFLRWHESQKITGAGPK